MQAGISSFFGWCTLINFTFLIVATGGLMLKLNWVVNIHERMFGVPGTELPKIYFKYLAYFKLAAIIFSLNPYLALRIIS